MNFFSQKIDCEYELLNIHEILTNHRIEAQSAFLVNGNTELNHNTSTYSLESYLVYGLSRLAKRNPKTILSIARLRIYKKSPFFLTNR